MNNNYNEYKPMSSKTIDECDEIARLVISSMHVDATAQCVASSVENALLAVDHFASARGEQYDSTVLNDGSVDAWGWSESTPDGDMNWRCTIRIIEAGKRGAPSPK